MHGVGVIESLLERGVSAFFPLGYFCFSGTAQKLVGHLVDQPHGFLVSVSLELVLDLLNVCVRCQHFDLLLGEEMGIWVSQLNYSRSLLLDLLSYLELVVLCLLLLTQLSILPISDGLLLHDHFGPNR